MPDPVTTILSGLTLMPSAQALALMALRSYEDIQLYDGPGLIVSQYYEDSDHDIDGQISGTVAVSGAPAQRRVVLFDHRTMRPLASTWSDPVTGAYSFSGLALNKKYLVVCDDYTRTYNAAVADWVEAE